MTRLAIFLYGLATYVFTLGVFVYGMGFIGGFFTPTALDAPPTLPLAAALAIDLGLLAVFAVQHSGMARPAFKRWWTRIVPESAERSTYVLVSSVLMVVLFAAWQPIGGVVWEVTNPIARDFVIGFYLFGWLLLVYTTFLIDHFDLFGLTQVWRQLLNLEYRPPQFHTPNLYKAVRHPLYIGWLIIFWAAPVMTIAHLVFALMTTAYILIAIQFEERDLVAAFGEKYLAYRRRTGMLVPKLLPPSNTPTKESAR
ncbi:MAG TPA: isoprenylcysteine carboxylmethyltransferase family protein [Hyphomonadaceae bacterium]|nr:isoprenylcysteine carboxylmethyltransferase family protein [Hyphomonadaceae bacterium]